jgi:hypothetical protein
MTAILPSNLNIAPPLCRRRKGDDQELSESQADRQAGTSDKAHSPADK